MSLDYRLFFVSHICIMALFMAGGLKLVSVPVEIEIEVVLLLAIAFISLRNRLALKWRWSRPSPLRALGALGSIVLIGLFLFGASPNFPISNPAFLPWFLAAINIGIFGVLSALGVVQMSNADFLRQCGDGGTQQPGSPAAPPDAFWKRAVRFLWSACFLLVWLDGVALFYFFGVGMRDGSPVMTAAQTEALNSHGKIAYVTKAQAELIHLLQTVATVGIPIVIVPAVIERMIQRRHGNQVGGA